MSITLFGWPPAFGVLGPSPFPVKTEIHLQLLGLGYTRQVADLDTAPKQKAPYVLDGDTLVEDSTFIRWHFEKKLGRNIDAHLAPRQRATAWAMERLLEDRLYFIMVFERWLEGDNFERGPAKFFAAIPEPKRSEIIAGARDGLRMALSRSGLGRHSRAERLQLAAHDIAALGAFLGDNDYMMGGEASALDGAAFGMIESASAPIFDSPLASLIAAHENLVDYRARMTARFFANLEWPALAA